MTHEVLRRQDPVAGHSRARAAASPRRRMATGVRAAAVLVIGLGLQSIGASGALGAEGPAGRRILYAACLGGPFFVGGNPDQLTGEGVSFGLMLRAGVQVHSRLAFEADFQGNQLGWDSGPPVPPPPDGEFDAKRSLDSWGLSLSAKGMWPAGRLQPYAAGGFGFYRGEMTVHGSQVVGVWPLIFEMPITRKESNISPGIHLAGGLNVLLSRKAYVGLEFRRLWLNQDFGRLSGGDANLGGYSVMLSLGWLLDEL